MYHELIRGSLRLPGVLPDYEVEVLGPGNEC